MISTLFNLSTICVAASAFVLIVSLAVGANKIVDYFVNIFCGSVACLIITALLCSV